MLCLKVLIVFPWTSSWILDVYKMKTTEGLKQNFDGRHIEILVSEDSLLTLTNLKMIIK